MGMRLVGVWILGAVVFGGAPALANEPTEGQMREAILRAMQNRGGSRSGDASVSVDNALSGMSLTFTRFKKIACEKATSRAGYNCDYEFTVRMDAHSNEGTAEGDRHAAGVNALMGLFGPREESGTGSKRFVLSDSRWVAINE